MKMYVAIVDAPHYQRGNLQGAIIVDPEWITIRSIGETRDNILFDVSLLSSPVSSVVYLVCHVSSIVVSFASALVLPCVWHFHEDNLSNMISKSDF
jgi:hypothetical protein